MNRKPIKDKRFVLKNIQDLIELGKQDILTPEEYSKVISQVKPFVGIFLKKYSKSSEMAVIIEKYSKLPKLQERPIFFGLDI